MMETSKFYISGWFSNGMFVIGYFREMTKKSKRDYVSVGNTGRSECKYLVLESALLSWKGLQWDIPINICSELLECMSQSFKFN